jgi:hypothetical protein
MYAFFNKQKYHLYLEIQRLNPEIGCFASPLPPLFQENNGPNIL